MPNRISIFLLKKTPLRYLIKLSKKIILPFFDGLPLYDLLSFFFRGIQEGYITARAASIAFNFFMAMFPAIIFLFSLIPFIPIDNFQGELLIQIKSIFPKNTYQLIDGTLEDLINHKRTNLLSFGFLLTVYFATNGVNSIISAFNLSYHSIDIGTRSWISQQFTAIWLTIVLTFFLILGVGLITFGHYLIEYIAEVFPSTNAFEKFLLGTAKWTIIISFIYFSISFLFYWGPQDKKYWNFFSAGSSLATTFTLLFSSGFAYYVNNFGSYNKLYGSIGTIMVIMFLIYLNCIALLIGYELNAAIKGAKNRIIKFDKSSTR